MNVKHARRLAAVKGRIREEPRRFDMDYWAETSDEAPCGTTACIAGHVVWRSLGSKGRLLRVKDEQGGDYIQDRARELLGLDYAEAAELFYHDQWPQSLREQYQTYGDPKKNAEVACDVIDRFLADRGFGPDGERAKAREGEGESP